MHMIEASEGNYFSETKDQIVWTNILEEYSQKLQKSCGKICIP